MHDLRRTSLSPIEPADKRALHHSVGEEVKDAGLSEGKRNGAFASSRDRCAAAIAISGPGTARDQFGRKFDERESPPPLARRLLKVTARPNIGRGSDDERDNEFVEFVRAVRPERDAVASLIASDRALYYSGRSSRSSKASPHTPKQIAVRGYYPSEYKVIRLEIINSECAFRLRVLLIFIFRMINARGSVQSGKLITRRRSRRRHGSQRTAIHYHGGVKSAQERDPTASFLPERFNSRRR